MLETVQQASFRIDSLLDESSVSKAGRTPEKMTTCVWLSSPVTRFPTQRKAGTWIVLVGWLDKVTFFELPWWVVPLEITTNLQKEFNHSWNNP